MSAIYADMFLRDQWIKDHSRYRHAADTSRVYESIFKKYGYDSEDYNRSIDYYMNDPERFARILRKTNVILDNRIKDLKHQVAIRDAARERQEQLEMYNTSYKVFMEKCHLPDTLIKGDSIVLYLDTNVIMPVLYRHEAYFDTLYVGPELIFPSRDTTTVTDSLGTSTASDSLKLADLQVDELSIDRNIKLIERTRDKLKEQIEMKTLETL